MAELSYGAGFHPDDNFWMRRCFQLAAMGRDGAAPNPMVGCVLVHPRHGWISEGWHTGFGRPHAEAEAIGRVADPALLPGATAFVNLEPCSHFGKTPPCAGLLIRSGIARVVVANTDPNPLVSGKGIAALRQAGARVTTGVLEEEGLELNRMFFTAMTHGRPWVTLKWARSADGFLAGPDRLPVAITGEESRVRVHRLRSLHQAIFAGRGTWRADQPSLNLRVWKGRQPVRLVFDPEGNLPAPPALAGSATWIFSNRAGSESPGVRYLPAGPGVQTPHSFLQTLYREGIHSLLVEGGAITLRWFLESGLWDEAHIFTGPGRLSAGVPAPVLPSGIRLRAEANGPDTWEIWRPGFLKPDDV